jgi:molybdopterin synthase sulfur carrier subunit
MYFTGMEVRVLLFASYADAFGAPNIAVTMREGATVTELLTKVREMATRHSLPPAPLIALNQEYASPSDVIHAGDEVALIPPVAGG